MLVMVDGSDDSSSGNEESKMKKKQKKKKKKKKKKEKVGVATIQLVFLFTTRNFSAMHHQEEKEFARWIVDELEEDRTPREPYGNLQRNKNEIRILATSASWKYRSKEKFLNWVEKAS
uniref:Uncharacterized protein n=1 Tax=Vespula pensylvanica TaxID=30213 RepID=A0A834UE59_VESPE|nr:hypothetical protein H0235_002252 [Vespula pensylvanica]